MLKDILNSPLKRGTKDVICCAGCGKELVLPYAKYFIDPLSVPCPECGLINNSLNAKLKNILNFVKGNK